MSCGRLTPATQKSLYSDTDSQSQYQWFADWVPCTGVDSLHFTMSVSALTNDFKCRPAYQTAEVRPADADSPVHVTDTWRTADGAYYDTVDLSSVTNGKFFIRFGVEYKVVSQGTAGRADIEIQAAYLAKGAIRGSISKELTAVSNSVEQREVISEWIPACEVSEINAAYVATRMDSGFEFRFAYQTAAAITETPDDWTEIGVGGWISSPGEDNIGDSTVTTTGKMWVRIGVLYSCTESNTNKIANLSAIVATR